MAGGLEKGRRGAAVCCTLRACSLGQRQRGLQSPSRGKRGKGNDVLGAAAAARAVAALLLPPATAVVPIAGHAVLGWAGRCYHASASRASTAYSQLSLTAHVPLPPTPAGCCLTWMAWTGPTRSRRCSATGLAGRRAPAFGSRWPRARARRWRQVGPQAGWAGQGDTQAGALVRAADIQRSGWASRGRKPARQWLCQGSHACIMPLQQGWARVPLLLCRAALWQPHPAVHPAKPTLHQVSCSAARAGHAPCRC